MKRKKNEVNLFVVRWVNFLLGLILGLGLAILIQLYVHPTGGLVTPLKSIEFSENKWPSGYGPKLDRALEFLERISIDIHAMREKLAK